MYSFIRNHQLDIMLALCAICLMMAVLMLLTRFLPRKRKWILTGMEIIAVLLLGFDRFAYIYSGNPSATGYVMVRLSNFMVFFLTSAIVFWFNLYILDLLSREAKVTSIPGLLSFVGIASAIGMILAVVTVFTGLYYSFDSNNVYHRGRGFLIAYFIPVLCPIIQFLVIHKYRKYFSFYIYLSLMLYIFVPIVVGIIQIFAYGLSIVNMAMVLVSVSLYIFTYLDINDEVMRVHSQEIESLKEEQNIMKRLFNQTIDTFVSAMERRERSARGISEVTARFARKIAQASGMSEDDCDKVYYTAFLHNAGFASLPDKLVGKTENLTAEEQKIIKNIPVLSAEILSNIKEYPYLSHGALYVHEHYDGTGYPSALKGEQIPEISRIVAVAASYASMSVGSKNKKPVPSPVIREEFIKEAGSKYDPKFANIMVQLIDSETNKNSSENAEKLETELICKDYREHVSLGIPIMRNFTAITFTADSLDGKAKFSMPSVVLFDSYDRHAHSHQKTIDAYHYLEYGELWFDGHSISTGARNMEVHVKEGKPHLSENAYKITAARYDDHVLVTMECGSKFVEAIIALQDVSKSVYIGLTGENCRITGIATEVAENQIGENEIPRIADPISYIDRLESDIPNVQINGTRSAYSEGIKIDDCVHVTFYTKSLPEANLVWHCPYIILYYSDDKTVGGKGYKEYAFIKLNGEDNGSNDFAENHFTMRKSDSFGDWSTWKNGNKEGFECTINFMRNGNRLHLKTENLGIYVENETFILDGSEEVYAALTGDLCALTDIRIKKADK